MVTAIAHERQLRAVGGPAERARRAARPNQLLGRRRVGDRAPPHLAMADECHPVALGRDLRPMSLADAPRRAARRRHDPDRLLYSADETVGIRILALVVQFAAANEHDGPGVGRTVTLAPLLYVVH